MRISSSYHTPLGQRNETFRTNPRTVEIAVVLTVIKKIRHRRYDSRKYTLVKFISSEYRAKQRMDERAPLQTILSHLI